MALAGAPAMSSAYGTAPPQGVMGPGSLGPQAPQQQMTPDQQALFAQQAAGGGGTYMPFPPGPAAAAPPPPPPPPGLQAMPDFMTPAMQQYVNQFHASQGAQQQAINSGLVAAMQGLGQRRDAAAKVVATSLPALQSMVGQQQAANNVTAAETKGGITPTVNGQSLMQLAAANTKGDKTANTAANAAENAANVADYTKGAQTLSNEKMQNQDQLALQQQQFDEQMALSKATAQQQWNTMLAGYAHDASQAKLNSNLSTQGAEQQALWMKNHGMGPASPADTIAYNAGFSNGAAGLAAARSNPMYSQAQQIMSEFHGAGTPDSSGMVTVNNQKMTLGNFYQSISQSLAYLQQQPGWADVQKALQLDGVNTALPALPAPSSQSSSYNSALAPSGSTYNVGG